MTTHTHTSHLLRNIKSSLRLLSKPQSDCSCALFGLLAAAPNGSFPKWQNCVSTKYLQLQYLTGFYSVKVARTNEKKSTKKWWYIRNNHRHRHRHCGCPQCKYWLLSYGGSLTDGGLPAAVETGRQHCFMHIYSFTDAHGGCVDGKQAIKYALNHASGVLCARLGLHRRVMKTGHAS